jgi:hypothetical protein
LRIPRDGGVGDLRWRIGRIDELDADGDGRTSKRRVNEASSDVLDGNSNLTVDAG